MFCRAGAFKLLTSRCAAQLNCLIQFESSDGATWKGCMWLTALWRFWTRVRKLQPRILGDAIGAEGLEGERFSLSLAFLTLSGR